MRIPHSTNQVDLSTQYIDSILSISINGLEYKYHYNRISKLLVPIISLKAGDIIVITYHPNLSELREKQLNILGI